MKPDRVRQELTRNDRGDVPLLFSTSNHVRRTGSDQAYVMGERAIRHDATFGC